MTFVSQRERLNRKAFGIFEALDYDVSESADYFREKISDVDIETLISLRDVREGNERRTLLHNAARKGSMSVVLFLIRNGHQLDAIDSNVSKITPLMDAISNKRTEIALILVESGASLDFCDVNGENAFHYIARSGNCRLLRKLSNLSWVSKAHLMDLASIGNIKRRLPEDVAANAMMREILEGFRLKGQHNAIFERSSS